MRLHSLGLALSIIAVLVIAGVAISMNNTKSDIRQALNVTITSPSSGEVFQGNAPCSIKYAIIGGAPDYTVKLYYTVNQTFIFINYCNTSVEGAQQYNWITPLLTNLTVRIKIDVNTTSEEAYNLSGEFEIDSTPPSKPKPELPAHDSIAVEGYPRAREIKLKWSASGDDGDIGKASYYHARCYDNPINETNWDDIPQYWRINYSAVAYPGGYESCIFKNLEPDKIYYFAVKAYDNVGLSSGLSTCISIRTLKYEAWPDSITGAGVQWDPVNKTLYFIDSRTVTYTEVLMKGNLRVVNNAELKFNKVLFVMDCFEDWEYRIEVAPGGLVGYLEGGKFLLEYSNISTNVAIMPDGTERWHPYLFVAYRNARFWMLYSSMRHCGSKPEDIKNIKLSAVQIDAEVDVELGIEIRSSDVFIENSIITQNWGVFIRPSLPMQASPGIRNNIISHNRYGIVIKPRIDITEQWPINLIVNNFTNNGIGLYSDNARVGLEGCLFINNFYGTIYNNTPLDYPHNVSGVIYRSIFTFNKYAIAARNSSLKAISTIFINNTHINNTDFEASNFHSTVHLEDSYAEFKQCKFANNTYLELKLINISDPLISTIYCKGSTLNIANCSFYSNNGIDFDKADIWNYVAPGNPISTLLEGLTSTIHYELSNITIDSSNFTDNGYPFSANESFYNLNFAGHLNFTGYTERIPIKERVSGLAPVLDIEASKLGMPIHYSMISGYGYSPISTFLNITSNKFYGNLQGIFSFGPAITLKGNNITFTPWEGHLGSVSYPPVPSHYEGTINYFLICGNSPLTVQYNNISEYCIGIMWLFAEANFTGNNFTHNYFATVALGTAEIPDVITVGLRTLSREFKIALPPVISKLLDTLEKVNVVAGFVNNNYTNNLCSLVTLGGYQITLQYNYFDGMEGTQWFLTFIQTFFIYSNVTISNCTFAEHGGVEGPGFGYQIYAGSSTLHVSDSFIGDTLLGLLGYYCQMQIYNTTLKSLWALVVIGKAASAEVRNSDLYGGSYNDMGAACEASGGATLNLSNVNILAGDDGVWLGIGATLNIQYSKIANTFDGIESEQVSESTVSISSTSIFDIPGTGIKVYDANVDITESVFGECAAGINYQSTSAGKGLNLRDSEFKEIPGTVVLVSGTAANYARIAIENNTFSNCGECIVPTYVTGKIMYNEISASTLGARIENSELEVTNNHFVSVSTGAWARFLNSKTRIYNNTFYTCSIGIETEDSSCIVTENKIYN
ncbi:MAG: fibronectin type III domain-containing protein, partial [Candidatus Thermoplasmatota archaeon]|nr:fibronectin type III domain-containing protein [Candidatus Thermoplasmatota archaeon]